MREVKVTVDPDGSTKMDFSGYEGPSCLDAAEKLRALLASYGIQSQQTGFVAKPELAQSEGSQQMSQEGQTHG